MDSAAFFDGWTGIARTLVVGALAYALLLVVLRVSGKRTLSKLNAFDLVVTVALGSTLATILLNADVALAEGVAAFALLVGLQWAITRASVRSARFASLVKSTPRLLLWKGRFDAAALQRERVTEDEVRAAARAQGHGRVESLTAVVLETDGSLSIVATAAGGALDGVASPKIDGGVAAVDSAGEDGGRS